MSIDRKAQTKSDIEYYESMERYHWEMAESEVHKGLSDAEKILACRYLRARRRAEKHLTKLNSGNAIPD